MRRCFFKWEKYVFLAIWQSHIRGSQSPLKVSSDRIALRKVSAVISSAMLLSPESLKAYKNTSLKCSLYIFSKSLTASPPRRLILIRHPKDRFLTKNEKICQQLKDNNRLAVTLLICNSIISQNRQKGKSFCRFCKNYKCAEKEYCIYIILSLWCRKI